MVEALPGAQSGTDHRRRPGRPESPQKRPLIQIHYVEQPASLLRSEGFFQRGTAKEFQRVRYGFSRAALSKVRRGFTPEVPQSPSPPNKFSSIDCSCEVL